jgi:hypothetical protein
VIAASSSQIFFQKKMGGRGLGPLIWEEIQTVPTVVNPKLKCIYR